MKRQYKTQGKHSFSIPLSGTYSGGAGKVEEEVGSGEDKEQRLGGSWAGMEEERIN